MNETKTSGHVSATELPVNPGTQQSLNPPPTSTPPHESDLAAFQRLTGMDILNIRDSDLRSWLRPLLCCFPSRSPSTSTKSHTLPSAKTPPPDLAATNYGVYSRIVTAERAASVSYHWYKHVINILFLIQIVLPAITTALAAYSVTTKSPTAIAISIISTINIIAGGLLAYLKGQGLPQRKLLYKNQLERVRIDMEIRERQFREKDVRASVGAPATEGDKGLEDPATEAWKLEQQFLAAEKDEQDNSPDVYSRNATSVAAQKAAIPMVNHIKDAQI